MYRPRRPVTQPPSVHSHDPRACRIVVSGPIDAGITIAIIGDLDRGAAQMLSSVVEAVLASRARHVRLDLTWLYGCDDAGAHLLGAACDDAVRAGAVLDVESAPIWLAGVLDPSVATAGPGVSFAPAPAADPPADVVADLAGEATAYLRARAQARLEAADPPCD